MTLPRGSEALLGALQAPQTTTWSNTHTTAILFGYAIRYVWTGCACSKARSSVCRSAAASQDGAGVCAVTDAASAETRVAATSTPQASRPITMSTAPAAQSGEHHQGLPPY